MFHFHQKNSAALFAIHQVLNPFSRTINIEHPTQIRRTKWPVLTLYLQINWNKTYPKMEWACSDCFKTVVVLFTTRSTKLDVFTKRCRMGPTTHQQLYHGCELSIYGQNWNWRLSTSSFPSIYILLHHYADETVPMLSSINSSFLWYTVWTLLYS